MFDKCTSMDCADLKTSLVCLLFVNLLGEDLACACPVLEKAQPV
jgi:hypothetical protein